MSKIAISLTVNGEATEVETEPREHCRGGEGVGVGFGVGEGVIAGAIVECWDVLAGVFAAPHARRTHEGRSISIVESFLLQFPVSL